jgi:YHS domain-containing protein
MRFLIWVVVLFWSIALLRRAIAWMLRAVFGTQPQQNAVGGASEREQAKLAHRLVRDPVCGMHIPEDRSVALSEGQQELHFCSVECRDKYVGKRKLAANG